MYNRNANENTWIRRISALILVGALFATPLLASAAVGLGDKAPEFQANTDDGKVWRSRDHVGKGFVVLYFYPAAMTSGCTKQACVYRDNRSKLTELGATVVGISGDRPEGLKAFKGSNRLNFPLLSDPDGKVAAKFGVPTSKGGTFSREVDGKTIQIERGVTAARWTFIIDRDGRVVYKDTQVDPAGDGEAVLKALQRLSETKK